MGESEMIDSIIVISTPGHELWIEVTVPPKGPPRPLQLAEKENGVWKPLTLQ